MSSTVEEHMALYECEAKLCRYISKAFDGKPKVFDKEIECLYDNLFHDDFTLGFIDDKQSDRKAAKASHKRYVALGVKAQVIHLKKIGLNSLDVKFDSSQKKLGKHRKRTIHVIYTIKDGKIIRSQFVDDRLVPDRSTYERVTSEMLEKRNLIMLMYDVNILDREHYIDDDMYVEMD